MSDIDSMTMSAPTPEVKLVVTLQRATGKARPP